MPRSVNLALYVIVLTSLAAGCSVCRYDFIQDGRARTMDELKPDMDGCYEVATEGVDLVDKVAHEAAGQRWIDCMHERGYVVVKR